MRCYLARRRKTHCYSKSAPTCATPLLFVWQRKFGHALAPQAGEITCRRLWDVEISIPI
ncbi:hypothetical protein [Ottowia sp.]|uniref:hypothetical protein n=1 Tax=Ottowia sp. TaxID=1898956 RepID=UPI0025CE6D41|nr:hypothetical protein [Ottowia sp.]MBK6747364.1 hypothetical protein [Ottowia sp.]